LRLSSYAQAHIAISLFANVGLLREAEQQFRSALKIQPNVNVYLELVNVYLRLDLPNTALEVLTEASDKFTCEPRLLLGLARIYDMLNDPETAMGYYKRVLALDASNIESIACLGAHCFYSDQVNNNRLALPTPLTYYYLCVIV
jgi:tetratricopeptide repeat protein 8